MPRVYRLEVISRTVLILICVGLATGCGSTRAANGKTAVVAAFYPLAVAAEQVAGTSADIEDLTPSGAEPHDIELAPQAVARIERADVVLYLGHGFQPAVSDAVRNASGRAVDVLEGLPLHSGSGQDQDLTADPHVWLDPVLFERVVVDIAAALHRRAAAAPLLRRLSTLHQESRGGPTHCARKEIVTSHAALRTSRGATACTRWRSPVSPRNRSRRRAASRMWVPSCAARTQQPCSSRGSFRRASRRRSRAKPAHARQCSIRSKA